MSAQIETPKTTRLHPQALAPHNLVLGLAMAGLSGAICMQIIGRLGITPNTSIVGAIVAIALSRVFAGWRPLDSQNLIQTYTSAGGFAAANAGLLSVAICSYWASRTLCFPCCLAPQLASFSMYGL